jgi:outer membrane protein
MTRLTTTAAAVLLAGGVLFAHVHAQTTGQTTPPPTSTQKPTPPPLPTTQTPVAPAPKPAPLPFPPDAKIAYVQMQAVIAESKFGKCGSDILNQMKAKDQAALQAKQRDITAQQQKMQAQAGLVTESVMTQMQRDLDRMTRDYQALGQQLETDETNKNQDLLNDFQTKVIPLLEALRKDKDLQIILSADPGGAIVAVNTALDLSAELVKRLDVVAPDCIKKTGGN